MGEPVEVAPTPTTSVVVHLLPGQRLRVRWPEGEPTETEDYPAEPGADQWVHVYADPPLPRTAWFGSERRCLLNTAVKDRAPAREALRAVRRGGVAYVEWEHLTYYGRRTRWAPVRWRVSTEEDSRG